MNEKASTIAIVIRKLDVVLKIRTSKRPAIIKKARARRYHMIFAPILLMRFYNSTEEHSLLPINVCQPYTKRPSFSGLITFGPDVVGKRKDAFKIIAKNADKFLSSVSLSVFWEKYKQETPAQK
jgi:hypothetical protein